MNWNQHIRILMPAMSLALSACMTTPPADAEADADNVKVGQTVSVDGPRVRVVKVLEDSRCPMNARCIWAGRVRLQMVWLRPAGNKPFELTLGEPKQLADGAMTLTSVRPEKQTDKQIKSSDYRFSLKFQGGL